MLALTLGQELGFLSPPIAALFAAAAVLFAVFVMVELRRPEPMIELRLFTQPLLTVSVVTGFITFVCVSGVFFLGPFYLENVLGLDQQVTGLLLAVSPIALGVVSPVSGWLSDRFGVRPLTIAGLAVIALGFVGLLTLDVDTRAVGFALAMIPLGIGMGLFQSPNNSAIMGSVPAETPAWRAACSLTRVLGRSPGSPSSGRSGRRGRRYRGTADAPSVQVAALHQVLVLSGAIVVGGLLLAGWGLWRSGPDRAEPRRNWRQVPGERPASRRQRRGARQCREEGGGGGTAASRIRSVTPSRQPPLGAGSNPDHRGLWSARRSAKSAAATSWLAIPTDLNTVTSSPISGPDRRGGRRWWRWERGRLG